MFSWFSNHWKGIVTVAASIAVGIAVTALIIATAPVSLPALLVTTTAIAAGGAAGGLTSYYLGHYFDGKPTTVKGALIEAGISAVVSVATLGLGRVIAPAVSRVVAPAVAAVLPDAAAPVVAKLVTNGVSFAAAGATTGAGSQVANNAMNNRPLGENVPQVAAQSALFAGTLTVAGEAIQTYLRPGELPAPPPRVIDPVTQTTMKHYGLTPDSIVYRVTEPQWIKNGQITGNPKSMALVRDPYNMVDHPWAKAAPDMNLPKVPKEVNASSLGPSLNVAVQDPGIYGQPGQVKIGIRLGDILDRGGKIYPDSGAIAQGVKPLIVTFDGPVPVASQVPVPVKTVTTDTTASGGTGAPGAPSQTRGFTRALGGDD